MKRVCVQGKAGESVCGKDDWPLVDYYAEATCVDCLVKLVASERRFGELMERSLADQVRENEKLREAMTKEADAHDDACSALGARPCRCPFCEIAREGR